MAMNRDSNAETVGMLFGEFDVFHAHHAWSLLAARMHCPRLVVGLYSDTVIRSRHHLNRPVCPLEERAEMLVGTSLVDYVYTVEGDLLKAVQHVNPDLIITLDSPQKPWLEQSRLMPLPSQWPLQVVSVPLDEISATKLLLNRLAPDVFAPPDKGSQWHEAEETPNPKICTEGQLQQQLSQARAKGHCITTTNGSFDLLHPGHLRYLEKAAQMGGKLWVLVNDDASIQKAKGPSRPIFPLQDRLKTLSLLKCVDRVVPFRGDKPLYLIEQIKPAVHCKGGSFLPERIAEEKQLVEAHGGHFVTFELEGSFSSTNLLTRVQHGKQ